MPKSVFDLASRETDRVALVAILPAAFSNYLDVARLSGSQEDIARAVQLRLLADQALTDLRIAGGASGLDDALDAALADLRQARLRFTALEAQLLKEQAEGAENAADTLGRSEAARLSLMKAEEDVARRFPDFAELVAPSPVALKQLQASLAPGQALILPVAQMDRLVSVAVTRDRMVIAETALGAEEITALAQRLRASSETLGAYDTDAAHRLFLALFPQDIDEIRRDARELLFPASGVMARFSPALLLTRPAIAGEPLSKAPWLLRGSAVTIFGSLSDLVRDAKRTGKAGDLSGNFLGLGAVDSDASQYIPGAQYRAATASLPVLPASLGELQSLQAAVSDRPDGAKALLLTGPDANEAALRAAQGAQYGVVAFATHGLVSGEVPGLSEPALVLAPGADAADPAHDGLLTASEIAALDLDADWVILSACNTGSGSDSRAPAFSGLARAFRQAGARALMLSHWRVRDDAAARLSVETVKGAALGLSRAEALRRAQLALMQDDSVPDAAHPAIWAPFVIVEN